jgi:SAM-dependent methyltransferase
MDIDSVVIDGIRCYAPELARAGADFPADAFDRLVRLEQDNFWFRGRNRIITHLFRRYLGAGPASVLEIGCGTAFVLQALARFPGYTLLGAELHLDGLRHAKRRLPDTGFVQLDARRMPYRAEFDAIAAFDVIEHAEEDVLIMENVHQALKPGGLFVITVPQHRWLWSTQDEAAGHKRRYTRAELREKLGGVGFEIVHATSFVSLLLPAMLASRLRKRPGKRSEEAQQAEWDYTELQLPRALDTLADMAMRVEEVLIRSGLSLPVGGSLAIVARKRPPLD